MSKELPKSAKVVIIGGGVGGTGVAQGRYPSSLGTPDQPLSLWNEYTTGAGAAPYGGRPYYAYDEFGWGGGSFSYPADVELLYTLDYDLWVGSPSLSYDSDAGMWVVNIIYNDSVSYTHLTLPTTPYV